MNTLSFVQAGNAVTNDRHDHLEILKSRDIDLHEIEAGADAEDSTDFYRTTETVKSVLQPFKVFKPLSRNDFGKWETNLLIDYIIKTHHGFAKKNAAAIFTLAQKVTYRHGENHPELLTLNKIIFLFLHDLLNQMSKEEQVLFPYMKEKAKNMKSHKVNDRNISQSLKEKIKLLQSEHEKALTYLKVIRQVTNNFSIPTDGCNTYYALFEKMKQLEDDLNIHFHLEDDILFPNAIGTK